MASGVSIQAEFRRLEREELVCGASSNEGGRFVQLSVHFEAGIRLPNDGRVIGVDAREVIFVQPNNLLIRLIEKRTDGKADLSDVRVLQDGDPEDLSQSSVDQRDLAVVQCDYDLPRALRNGHRANSVRVGGRRGGREEVVGKPPGAHVQRPEQTLMKDESNMNQPNDVLRIRPNCQQSVVQATNGGDRVVAARRACRPLRLVDGRTAERIPHVQLRVGRSDDRGGRQVDEVPDRPRVVLVRPL